MNRVKKYTIVFVLVCFIGIIGLGFFNPSHPAENLPKDEPVVTEESQQTTQQLKQSETKQTTQATFKDSNKKEQTQSSQPSTQKKTQTTTPKEEVVEKIQISMNIYGFNHQLVASQKMKVPQKTTVYKALVMITKKNHLELKADVSGSLVYVKGIAGLNEKEHGRHSGWIYKVNGVAPHYGAGMYELKNGDKVEWYYTTE